MENFRLRRLISLLWVIPVVLVWAIAIGTRYSYRLVNGPFSPTVTTANARSGYAMGSAVADTALVLMLPTLFFGVLLLVIHLARLTPLQTRIARVLAALLSLAGVAIMFGIVSPFF